MLYLCYIKQGQPTCKRFLFHALTDYLLGVLFKSSVANMKYKNETGQPVVLVTLKDGELVGIEIPKDWSGEFLSSAEILRRKFYRQLIRKPIQGKFVKMFISTKQLAEKFKDYDEAFRAITYLIEYIQPKSNILMKGERKWQKDDLSKDMGVSRQTAYRYIDKMIEEQLLKQITILGKGKVWVVNPYYFENGEDTIEEVINAFSKPRKEDKVE